MQNEQVPGLSIVIPIFNEEAGIKKLFEALNSLAPRLPANTEVILVDDGSSDQSIKLLTEESLVLKKSIISFSRNFGHQSALLAGLKLAKGDFVVTMDGDLQHPPTLIPTFLDLHSQGHDIVLTKRQDSDILRSKYVFSSLFYSLINKISATSIPVNSSDFRSMSRRAVNALLALPENRKFLRGLVGWIGYPTAVIEYQPDVRVAGESKYTWIKMLRLAMTGITSFSAAPMYLAGAVSVLFFSSAFLYAIYVLIIKFIYQTAVSGWASVLFVLLIVSGFLSLFLGLIGVYLSAIYEEVKNRPNYIIKDLL
jgi:glycosyltransferase involved in cell wall biosynthesis